MKEDENTFRKRIRYSFVRFLRHVSGASLSLVCTSTVGDWYVVYPVGEYEYTLNMKDSSQEVFP
jgi:hypothetical protein